MGNALQMSAAFHRAADHLVLTYEVVNADHRDAYLLNRLYRTVPAWDISPDIIYVHLDPGAEAVCLSKQLAELPTGFTVTAPVAPFVTPVRAGSSFREEVKVPLPVREYREYPVPPGAAGRVLRPRVYRHASFTLGYYWRPEGTVEKRQDVHGTAMVLPRTPPGRPVEFGFLQTDTKRLDMPVLEPVLGRAEEPVP